MAKYRKKSIVVEAEQFFPDKKPWPDGVHTVGGEARGEEYIALLFRIDTPEGPLRVSAGDWIIIGIKGERYPCKPDVFAATYEACET